MSCSRRRVIGIVVAAVLLAQLSWRERQLEGRAFADGPEQAPKAAKGAKGANAAAATSHVVQTHGPASLRTAAPLNAGRLTIAFTDQIAMTVQVTGGARLEVKPPQSWAVEPWHVSRVEPPAVETTSAGSRWSQRFWLEPLAPGEIALKLTPLHYRDKAGQWQEVGWQPITVIVSARLKQPDAASARDITSIEELPGAPERESAWWIAAAIASAAVAGAAAWRWLRRRRAPPGRSPEAWALTELDRLTGLRLAERGKGERFAALLAGLVRRYLEKKFHVPARRQTTAEFLASLPPALAEQRSWLEALFTRCDQIKFAPIEVHADECARLIAEVRSHLAVPDASA